MDNRDGYNRDAADGGEETARKMQRTFKAMLDAGIEDFYDWSITGHSFRVSYQVYQNPDADRPDYCSPQMGAVEVESWTGPSEGWYSPPTFHIPKRSE